MAGPLPIGDPAPADGSLPAQAAVGAADRTFHAYVHIPFCTVRCGYCDFNTYTAGELAGARQSDYADVLIAEVKFSAQVIMDAGLPKRKLSTVFFGGGTPTLLPASDLARILEALRNAFEIVEDAEVTTEANPDTVDADYLRELRNGGFNRVSFGMQSAVSSVLATLERSHNPENVSIGVAAAKELGLKTSVDLIYGAPGETLAEWRQSVETAIAMQPDHISAYALIVEDGTKLARQIKAGQLAEPDEDLQADKYELADSLLADAGFDWYEVSNWSRGSENLSAHNISYWASQDWWGYGPGAHSHVGGVRWWNVKHPTSFAAKLAEGNSPAAGRETLSERTRLEERVLLEIRISEGLSVDLAKKVNPDAGKLIAGFIADELVDAKAAIGGVLKLTLKGRLLADSLVRKLLAD
ncbi:radical SAM family heme chaperone HemW [Rhodoluna lacicola]|uniref:Heme chaperone HemW n=1 Tax=Rhodoluna lacicola TaxID=529884 RepID=A0A060JF94_9MICO|nr:radical SAM family heme chaperone HemW [Rhodoluna lacicola]AIC47425.1 putative oxygen-independent coproporphyrinogen III oxidase [Rhodoluna lacicola]